MFTEVICLYLTLKTQNTLLFYYQFSCWLKILANVLSLNVRKP